MEIEMKKYWETRLPQSRIINLEKGNKISENLIGRYRFKKHKYIKSFVNAKRFNGKSVLEVGCGLGTDSIYLAKHGCIVTGVDITENSINTCKKRFKIHDLDGDFKLMSATNLKFSSNYFDLVYSFGVIHHLPDTKKALQEIWRVLKPNAKAIIRVNSRGWWYYGKIFLYNGILKGKIFKLSKQELLNNGTVVDGESPLVKYFSKKQIKDLFVNFRIKKIKRHYLGGYSIYLPYWLCESLLAKFLGNHWMIEAEKIF